VKISSRIFDLFWNITVDEVLEMKVHPYWDKKVNNEIRRIKRLVKITNLKSSFDES
jgi:hypothetical protein